MFRSVGVTPTEAELNEIVTEADAQAEDGKLSESYVIELIRRKNKAPDTETEIREAFLVFDKDGNGLVSAAEFAHVLTHLGEQMTDEEAAEIVREVQQDVDGNVKYEDLIRVMLS